MSRFKPKEIEAYQTTDGSLFACYDKACEHQGDIVGALLDTLLPHDERENFTRIDRHNLLMKMFEDKNLHKIIYDLNEALNYKKD